MSEELLEDEPDDSVRYVNMLIIETLMQNGVKLNQKTMPAFEEISDYSFESVKNRLKILCNINPWVTEGKGTFTVRLMEQPRQIQMEFDEAEIKIMPD